MVGGKEIVLLAGVVPPERRIFPAGGNDDPPAESGTGHPEAYSEPLSKSTQERVVPSPAFDIAKDGEWRSGRSAGVKTQDSAGNPVRQESTGFGPYGLLLEDRNLPEVAKIADVPRNEAIPGEQVPIIWDGFHRVEDQIPQAPSLEFPEFRFRISLRFEQFPEILTSAPSIAGPVEVETVATDRNVLNQDWARVIDLLDPPIQGLPLRSCRWGRIRFRAARRRPRRCSVFAPSILSILSAG